MRTFPLPHARGKSEEVAIKRASDAPSIHKTFTTPYPGVQYSISSLIAWLSSTFLPHILLCHYTSSAQEADMEDGAISDLVSGFARLPAIMIVGDVYQTPSTRPEPFHNSSQVAAAHPTPPSTQSDATSHVRYRNTPHDQTLQQEGQRLYNSQHHLQIEEPPSTGALPPPSPRLEPTHRSTLSLNGSVASSPSRIKVRDLGHIQSFASEEVLTRSRHPSRHSLRGRLTGGQQYEISAMPVADIIEMVAGLLTKITTTVGSHSYCRFGY